MKEKTDKLLTLVMLLLGVLCAVFAFFFAIDNIKFTGMFDIVFWVLVALIAVSVIAMIYFLFKRIVTNGKLVKFLIGCATIAAVIIVLFLLSKGTDVSDAMLERNGVTQATSKWIGAACYAVYLLVIGAACAIVYVEVAKSFKKK
jgi:NADH:ubiquinone oxidoreductase subunit 6 (subunit J)